MVNRIQEILNRYNLTAAKLADQLEVPRSTISHILTGRNKTSLEFVQKVLQHFPEISTDWLIKGVGTMKGKQQDLFSELEIDRFQIPDNPKEIHSIQKNNPPEISPEPPSVDANGIGANLRREKDDIELSNSSENHVFKDEKKPIQKSKKIVRIITFHNDNTFEEFFPSNQED